tara:strand:- start:1551 stop:1844 length:294 start_codon:yes stop_codon:yes gene_type:complete
MTDLSSNNVILNIEEEENNNNIIVKDGKLSESFEIEMNIIDKEVDEKYSEIMEKNKCPINCNEIKEEQKSNCPVYFLLGIFIALAVYVIIKNINDKK